MGGYSRRRRGKIADEAASHVGGSTMRRCRCVLADADTKLEPTAATHGNARVAFAHNPASRRFSAPLFHGPCVRAGQQIDVRATRRGHCLAKDASGGPQDLEAKTMTRAG